MWSSTDPRDTYEDHIKHIVVMDLTESEVVVGFVDTREDGWGSYRWDVTFYTSTLQLRLFKNLSADDDWPDRWRWCLPATRDA